MLPDVQHVPSQRSDRPVPRAILPSALRVVTPIHFHDEADPGAREVDDVLPDDELTPKREASLGPGEPPPEPLLRAGWIAPHDASPLFEKQRTRRRHESTTKHGDLHEVGADARRAKPPSAASVTRRQAPSARRPSGAARKVRARSSARIRADRRPRGAACSSPIAVVSALGPFTKRSSPFRAQAEGRARIWGRQPAKPAGRGHPYPDGHTRTQAYDDLGRITSRCYEYSGPTTRCYTASYDAVGNPVTMSDPDGSDTLEYDALDRLKKVTRVASGVTTVEDYAYNALGALKVNAGVVLDDQRPKLAGGGTAGAAVPANVGGQPVVLDAGGRVTSLRGTTFTWTRDGTLREADDPIPAAPEMYGVDARSRRYSRIVSGTAQEYYVYEGLDRVAVIGPNVGSSPGAVIESYLFDGIDHPLRIARPGASTNYYYYEIDLAGNVRGLRASGGASLGGYRYSAFGQTVDDTSLINQPLRWKARWFSPVAGGTYDVRARQWSPELGTFLEIDEFSQIQEAVADAEQGFPNGAVSSPADLLPGIARARLTLQKQRRSSRPTLSGHGYHDLQSTLWGWPGQNPIINRDPTGRGDFDDSVLCEAAGWLAYFVCLNYGLNHYVCVELGKSVRDECNKNPPAPNPNPNMCQ